jgi:hypothetical protein
MITVAVAVIITTTINTCRQVRCVEASTQPSCNLKILHIPSGEMSYLCQGTDRNVVIFIEFYVLLTVLLGIFLVNDVYLIII